MPDTRGSYLVKLGQASVLKTDLTCSAYFNVLEENLLCSEMALILLLAVKFQ